MRSTSLVFFAVARPSSPKSVDPPDVAATKLLFQNEDRDLPCRLRLVFGVRGKGLDRQLPPRLALSPVKLACREGDDLVAVLQRHCRISLQVRVPKRVLRGAALRRHYRVAAVLFHAH